MSDYTPTTKDIEDAYVWAENQPEPSDLGETLSKAAFARWLAEHDRQVEFWAKIEVLRETADQWVNEIYPEDVFIPLTSDNHAEINQVLTEHFGRSSVRDVISADMMRRAANILRRDADRLESDRAEREGVTHD